MIKVICWGEFMVYDNNKMSFEHIMPIEDIGLPTGYKYTRSDKQYAIKHFDDYKYKRREKEYSKNIVKNINTVKKTESIKYENYFKLPERPKTAAFTKIKEEVKVKAPKPPETEFQQEIKGMISQLEKQVKADNKPYDQFRF